MTPEDRERQKAERIEKERQETIDFAKNIPFSKLGIENFKVIESYQSFDFKPITLLTGQNSSGKSTLIELINILSKNNFIDNIHLNELGEKIGSFSNAISKNAVSQEFTIAFLSRPNNLDEDLQVTITYRVNGLNKQQADICYYGVENENQTIFEIRRNEEGYVNGYINYPFLWQGFSKTFKRYLELKYTNQKGGFVDENGNIESFEYSYSKNYFKQRDKQINYGWNFSLGDFDEFPLFYFTSFFTNNELTKNFIEVFQPELEDIIKWENELFNNFYFNDFSLGSELLVKNMVELIEESPYNLIKDGSGVDFLPIENRNPIQQYLSHIENNSDLTETENLIYNRLYLEFKGISKTDLDFLFSDEILNIHHGGRMEYDYNEIINDDRISNDTKEILKKIRRTNKLRKEFCHFISNELIFPIENTLPKNTLFIPVNRSLQKIALQNLGSSFRYDNFLQEVSVKYLELSSTQKREIDKHITRLISIFNIGDSSKIISSERLLDIIITKGKHEFNIAEEGFGISQLFSIVLGICVNAINKYSDQEIIDNKIPYEEFNLFKSKSLLVCIEEPESNLHPNFQSLLADMFVYLSKELNIQFIIETHSEYLFRRLRYLTHLWYKEIELGTDMGIPKEYWNSYYFNKKENVSIENPKIFEIFVEDNEGKINRQFGDGFLDIATKAHLDHLELLNINKELNKN